MKHARKSTGVSVFKLAAVSVHQENRSGTHRVVNQYFPQGNPDQLQQVIRLARIMLQVLQNRQLAFAGFHVFASRLPEIGVQGKPCLHMSLFCKLRRVGTPRTGVNSSPTPSHGILCSRKKTGEGSD